MFDVRRSARAIVMATAVSVSMGIGSAAAVDLVETPSLKDAVASGALPPVQERAPSEPQIVEMKGKGLQPGRQGGKLNTLIDKAKSVRYFVVWGYSRLVGYTPDLELKPDILKDVKVEDNRVFTMTLRKGHKWSDGAPFTTEDFRYYWEDIANNEELSPAGPLADLLVDGKPPKVEIIDEVTVRYSWESPNPTFLESLARSRPPFIYRPAHYLKQFHKKYGDAAKIEAAVKEAKVRTWASLHNRNDQMYKNTNVDMPTLQPWMNTTSDSKTRFVLKRNPYFHRVDSTGKQLPYIDEVIATVAASKLIPAKAVAGETDLQARSLSFANIAILKHGEKTAGYKTLLWPISKASNLALYPNLNTNDPVWRKLLRSTQFRCALSVGIDRKLVNKTLFLGLGLETGNSVLKQSPLYNASLSAKWAKYDPELANKILDELGLDKRDFRRLPAASRWAARGNRGRNGWREPGRSGDAAARVRDLEEAGFEAVQQTVTTRCIAGALVCRGYGHDRLVRVGQRHTFAADEPGRACADAAGQSVLAEMGAVLRNEGAERRGAGSSSGEASPRTLLRVAQGHQ